MAAKPLNTPLTAAEIAALCDGVHHGADFQALDVSTDSRRLQAGELFIALRGPNFRGEDFLAAAKGQGAVAAIVAEYQPDADLPQIVVADTLAALQALARDRRARSQAQFFAITGSNGKTSTKEILQRLLQTRGQTLATIGNLNNDIGVPLTLLRLRDED
ncbi:MAG: Mur ligase family protein, partial [Cardiobacterium hominis]